MNKRILGLALPNIITNITVPLLGMVDTAIVGHLSVAHLGGIAIGASIFNLIYWNFGFLRMGTSGFTAQAYGARRFDEAVRILVRALAIAWTVALALILLQWPIARLSEVIFSGSGEVMGYALDYFFVRIWAAPATLGLYGLKGWCIGMQNSKLPMWIAIFLNVVNILSSLLFVLGFGWGIKGVALGTVLAQYSGLAIGLYFVFRYYGKLIRRHIDIRGSLRWSEMRGFFKVNGDIFLRTVCLSLVFTFVTAASGRISDQVLAIDTLLLQFFHLFSYFMDGFAYAGESLVGRYIGARDQRQLRLSVRYLLLWGLIITVAFTGLYALFGRQFLSLFSNDPTVVEGAMDYLLWVLVIPVCGFAAFLFDGIFIGATASRTMRNSMFVASACFFLVYYGGKWLLYGSPSAPPSQNELWSNNILWLAFMVYISLRGILQALRLKPEVYAQASR
ncbi:MAG: MATE family efflux transporter [Bacteroidales bacterium]|nr:MATE family efflux transporter [Bacteroidales bacterium]